MDANEVNDPAQYDGATADDDDDSSEADIEAMFKALQQNAIPEGNKEAPMRRLPRGLKGSIDSPDEGALPTVMPSRTRQEVIKTNNEETKTSSINKTVKVVAAMERPAVTLA